MSVAERQWTITIHQILLYSHEAFEIRRMITHHLKHMLQTIVLQENVHQQIECLAHTHTANDTYQFKVCLVINQI